MVIHNSIIIISLIISITIASGIINILFIHMVMSISIIGTISLLFIHMIMIILVIIFG